MSQTPDLDEPRYTISVVARLVNLHPQTLRNYEELELVVPRRSPGNFRLYTERDVQRLHKIVRLSSELGINLAGVEVILNMSDRVEALQAEVDALRAQLARFRRQEPARADSGDADSARAEADSDRRA
jgi:MerR family transcriptional regulator/heat shock protein HspR